MTEMEVNDKNDPVGETPSFPLKRTNSQNYKLGANINKSDVHYHHHNSYFDMLKNYLTIALRNFKRQPGYTFLNIFGFFIF